MNKTETLLLLEYGGSVSKTNISLDKENKLVLKGIIQRKDTRNGNGRIYPGAILEREIKKYQALIENNRGLSEVDHPQSVEVSLQNAGLLLRRTWWESNELWGEFTTTSNSKGRDLRALVENDGLIIGVSSRGYGSVSKKGEDIIVNEDFNLVCFDAVFDPSTAGAFILREGKYVRVDERKLLEGKSINESCIIDSNSKDFPKFLNSKKEKINNLSLNILNLNKGK